MADLTNKKSNVISDMVAGADLLMRGKELLEQTQAEISSAGLTFADGDFVGSNAHLAAVDFTNLQNTATQLDTLLGAHKTNLNKARP
jgi:hypothetical protein